MQDWLSAGFKALLSAVIAIGVYVFNSNSQSLTKSIELLTTQLRTMEQHQIETDKRVLAIEVSREINQSGYQKVVSDVQDMKATVLQLNVRMQTVSDFIAKHFDSKR